MLLLIEIMATGLHICNKVCVNLYSLLCMCAVLQIRRGNRDN